MGVDGVIRECGLAEGLKVVISDASSHYFGGYYHVRLQVAADVRLDKKWFDSVADYEDALRRLGRFVRFSRTLEKMAVPLEKVDEVRETLLDSFETNLHDYLSRPDFPRRFVRSEYEKALKSVVPCGYADI